MKRGDLYRVRRPGAGDPRRSRVFVVVSREPLIQSGLSTVVCVPVFSRNDGLSTQVEVGMKEGLKHPSSIHCDALISLPKSGLTDYVGSLSPGQLAAFDSALRVALAIE